MRTQWCSYLDGRAVIEKQLRLKPALSDCIANSHKEPLALVWLSMEIDRRWVESFACHYFSRSCQSFLVAFIVMCHWSRRLPNSFTLSQSTCTIFPIIELCSLCMFLSVALTHPCMNPSGFFARSLARSFGKEERAFCWENYGELPSVSRESDIHKRWLERDSNGKLDVTTVNVNPLHLACSLAQVKWKGIESIAKIISFFVFFFGNESNRVLTAIELQSFLLTVVLLWYPTMKMIWHHRETEMPKINQFARWTLRKVQQRNFYYRENNCCSEFPRSFQLSLARNQFLIVVEWKTPIFITGKEEL